MRIAAAATAIRSHARLNWKRGNGNQRRVGRVGEYPVQHDSSDRGRVCLEQRSRIIPFRRCSCAKQRPWRSPTLPLAVGAGLACRDALPCAGDEFLRGFVWSGARRCRAAGRNLQFAIDNRQQAIRGCGTMRFATQTGFGLRAAGEHGDEFAVFELGQYVHFAKRLFESGHGGSTICRAMGLPYLRLMMSYSSIFKYRIGERDAEAMAFGYAPLEHLNERGPGLCSAGCWRRLPAGLTHDGRLLPASVIGTWVVTGVPMATIAARFFRGVECVVGPADQRGTSSSARNCETPKLQVTLSVLPS